MALLMFVVVLAADFLLLTSIAISILFPKFQVWPPPSKGSWQQWLSWILFFISMVGVPLLGALDFGSLGDGYWPRFVIGILAATLGLGISIWGIRILSAQQSLGNEGKMVTEGPYKYTRNPQYFGFILFYTGIIVIASSFMALVSGALLVLVFLILPFSEEPWLRQRYGKQYEEYCEKVPRFVGFRSFTQGAD